MPVTFMDSLKILLSDCINGLTRKNMKAFVCEGIGFPEETRGRQGSLERKYRAEWGWDYVGRESKWEMTSKVVARDRIVQDWPRGLGAGEIRAQWGKPGRPGKSCLVLRWGLPEKGMSILRQVIGVIGPCDSSLNCHTRSFSSCTFLGRKMYLTWRGEAALRVPLEATKKSPLES